MWRLVGAVSVFRLFECVTSGKLIQLTGSWNVFSLHLPNFELKKKKTTTTTKSKQEPVDPKTFFHSAVHAVMADLQIFSMNYSTTF